MDFGLTDAVGQKDKELAEVHDLMVIATKNNWYEPGLIWKHAESEGRNWLHEKEEARIKHFEVENEYRREKHSVVKVRISSEILEMAYRTLKKRDGGTVEAEAEDNPTHSKLTKEEARRILCPPEDVERVKDIDRTQEEARQ